MDIAQPLRLKRGPGRPVPPDQFAKPNQKVSVNALLGMGLWTLLWLGYNTNLEYLSRPNFPANTTELIHGVRAFFPLLAGWLALIFIFARSKRLLPWLMGPLGLVLLFTVTGLASSATLSIDLAQAVYFGFDYLALVLVLLAIVLTEDPLADIYKVLKLTWVFGTVITLSLLFSIPFLGSAATTGNEAPDVVRLYNGQGTMMGMAQTRNTGFARYAAVSALVALARLLGKGKLYMRVIWGVILAASAFALYIANGRTEILAFVGSVALILGAEKAKRFINFLVMTAAAILLGFRGFYSSFFLYFTRTGKLDTTMTGRTKTWEVGLHLLGKSPWVGLGFQADRIFGVGHMHNAFLHVLVESGLLGGGAILLGLAIVWFYIIRYFFLRKPSDRSLIPAEIPAVFLFVTISSITESTFAYFSAAWLLSAPIVAYVVALHRKIWRTSAVATRERWQKRRLGRRQMREADSAAMEGMAPSTIGGRTPS